MSGTEKERDALGLRGLPFGAAYHIRAQMYEPRY